MPLEPVQRSSLSDAVFEQLAGEILSGAMSPGQELPSERALTELLGVNRGAVREALKRLDQARLVQIRHGGATTVLDFRTSGGLDLLPRLLVGPQGRVDAAVARGIMELRRAIGADAARLAAERADDDARAVVAQAARAMAEDQRRPPSPASLDRLQRGALIFWGAVVEASGNLAYRLAFNSLEHTYEPVRPLLASALAEELCDHAGTAAVVDAIQAGEPDAAQAAARALLDRGGAGIDALLGALEAL